MIITQATGLIENIDSTNYKLQGYLCLHLSGSGGIQDVYLSESLNPNPKPPLLFSFPTKTPASMRNIPLLSKTK